MLVRFNIVLLAASGLIALSAAPAESQWGKVLGGLKSSASSSSSKNSENAKSSENAGAQGDNSLTLGERVSMKRYQTTKYAALKKEIQTAAGYDVELAPEWSKMGQMCGADHYNDDDCFSDVFFKPLAEAFRQITKTPDGQQSLKAKVKKVVFTYDKQTACNSSGFEKCTDLKNGVLTLNFTPQYGTYEPDTRSKALVYFLEHNL